MKYFLIPIILIALIILFRALQVYELRKFRREIMAGDSVYYRGCRYYVMVVNGDMISLSMTTNTGSHYNQQVKRSECYPYIKVGE